MDFLKKMGKGIKKAAVSTINFVREGFRELKKVRWPSRKELVSYSTIVITTVLFVTVYFLVVDLGISSLLQVIGLGK